MAANGGHLTKQEQRQINRELNRNSKRIYQEKHGPLNFGDRLRKGDL